MRIQGVRALVDAGVAVMGHTGLMPQTISVMGGFRPQAQSAASALRVLRDAQVGAPEFPVLKPHLRSPPTPRCARCTTPRWGRPL